MSRRKQSIDDAMENHQLRDNAEFRECLSRMVADNPHRSVGDLLFIGDAIWQVKSQAIETIEAVAQNGTIANCEHHRGCIRRRGKYPE